MEPLAHFYFSAVYFSSEARFGGRFAVRGVDDVKVTAKLDGGVLDAVGVTVAEKCNLTPTLSFRLGLPSQ